MFAVSAFAPVPAMTELDTFTLDLSARKLNLHQYVHTFTLCIRYTRVPHARLLTSVGPVKRPCECSFDRSL